MKKIELVCIFLLLSFNIIAQSSDYQIGKKYYDNGDYDKAYPYLLDAANDGVADAQNLIGVCYKNGFGVEKDYSKAIYWYQKAANQGNALAQNDLGVCYDNGEGVVVDHLKAIYWYQKAADQGNATAQYNLGDSYMQGIGVEKDYSKAFYWFQKAADQGYVLAQINVGSCFRIGLGVEKNYTKAVYWYQKALDKDPNNSNAKKFLAAVQQKMDDERQKIADEKAKPDKDAKLIQEMFQEAKSYNISGDASKFDLRDKFLNEFISTCSKNPKYDKYKVLAKAKKLSSFCRVVEALYHWSDAPTNWYYEEKMLGLVKYPVWNERPTQMVIEAIDGALAICQKMTKDPDFGSFFTKSIPLLKEKRIKVNNNLSKERREYNAVVAENDARRESRNHEVDTDRHKSPSGELEFHTLLPADGYHYENDGELRSKSGSDYCTYNVHFDRNKKIDYYYIKSCSSKVRDYLKGKTKFKTGSELTSAFMNAIR